MAFDFVILSAIWGSSFLFTRLGTVEFGALATAFVRVAVATAFLFPIVVMRGQAQVLRRHWKPIFAIGLINSGIPFVCFAFALLTITSGLSAILNATVPLFGALVAWLWLGDRPDGTRLLGLAIGFGGVAALAWDGAGIKAHASDLAPVWAVLACLMGTLCYGIAACAAKKYLKGLPALVTATGSQMGAMFALIVPAAFTWPAQMPGTHAWAALVAVGVLCTGVAYVLYFRLIENLGPARAVAVTFVVPVFAIFYGVIFLGEEVTPRMVICGAIIIAGTALSTGLVRLPKRSLAGS